MIVNRPTALIAEDEPILAMLLQRKLAIEWPELEIVAVLGDGHAAVKKALELKPNVLFFDIRMPGLTGIEAAEDLLDAWQEDTFPALVFVTAYDELTLNSHGGKSIDYLSKPIQTPELQKMVRVLQQKITLLNTTDNSTLFNAALIQIRYLTQTQPPSSPHKRLTSIQASTAHTNVVCQIPTIDVVYFEATTSSTRLFALHQGVCHEYFLHVPLKELARQLDSNAFLKIHRTLLVRTAAIKTVSRNAAGKQHLYFHGCSNTVTVSKIYEPLLDSFKH